MKKPWLVQTALLFAYCVPFAFLCVNGDAVSGTMSYYGIMIIALSLLCWGVWKIKNLAIVYIGNLLSFASSCMAVWLSGLKPKGDYFKPFTSHSLIVFISVIALIAQTVILLLFRARKRSIHKE